MPKNIAEPEDKAREELVREHFEAIVATLQNLNRAERLRVLRTTAVFFNLERDVQFE